MTAREELTAALAALTEGAAPLGAGPAPTWRPGYDQDEPIYLACVRAMGIPGLDSPTGGDVVQGEIQVDPPVKHRKYVMGGREVDPYDPKTWGMPEPEPTDPDTDVMVSDKQEDPGIDDGLDELDGVELPDE